MSTEEPRIHPTAYLVPTAVVEGDVELAADCSVWHHAVIRADLAPVRIGKETNVQDGAIIHVSTGQGVTLGKGVIVGHGAIVHGCRVGDGSLVGMGAIVLDGATIGRDCIIGAGALVTKGTTIPDGSVAFGSPARVVRQVNDADRANLRANADEYVRLAREGLKARAVR